MESHNCPKDAEFDKQVCEMDNAEKSVNIMKTYFSNLNDNTKGILNLNPRFQNSIQGLLRCNDDDLP